MKYVSAMFVCLGLLLGFNASTEPVSASPAQVVNFDHDHVDVYYQLNSWRSRHFHDHHAAHHFMDAMRRLGCQVHEHDHDVHYICRNERFVHFEDAHHAYHFMQQMRALGFSVHKH